MSRLFSASRAILSVLSLIQVLSLSAFAADSSSVSPGDVNQINELETSIFKNPSSLTDCDPTGNSINPSCASVTDSICDRLASPEHDGNIDFGNGKLLYGNSDRSEMTMAKKLDLQALLASERKLPQDLRKKAEKPLAALRAALSHEEDSKEFYRSVGRALSDLNEAIDDTADDRVEALHPELKSIKKKDRDVEQNNLYSVERFKVRTELMNAKYESSENWKRVERVFGEAQSDLQHTVENLKIDSRLKAKILKKLAGIHLTLPFTDPNLIGADESCATTEVNAFYESDFNKFTVCAGYFNAAQNDDAMYLVIAHELSHSIDPVTFADDAFYKSTTGIALKKFAAAKGPVYSCDEWKKLSNGILSSSVPIQEPAYYPYRKLTDCLFPKVKLEKFDAENVSPVVTRMARQNIADVSDSQNFSLLSELTITQHGKVVGNPYYLRPDRVYAKDSSYIFPTERQSGSELIPAIFTQALSCEKRTQNGVSYDFASASRSDKEAMFQDAIQRTQSVMQAYRSSYFSTCGRECSDLGDDNISRNAQEAFADWLAIKTFPAHLARKSSIQERRLAAGLGFSLFCERSGPTHDAPWLTKIEKKFSLEPHPDERERRLSVFTPEVAATVGCDRRGEVEKGVSACGL